MTVYVVFPGRSVGREFCIVCYVFYLKTGTEEVAESYPVIQKQEMDGGQRVSVLANRAKVDWCYPPVGQCERALDEMVKLYLIGDESVGVKKHHVPVYKDKKSLKKARDVLVVLCRIKSTQTLAYLFSFET